MKKGCSCLEASQYPSNRSNIKQFNLSALDTGLDSYLPYYFISGSDKVPRSAVHHLQVPSGDAAEVLIADASVEGLYVLLEGIQAGVEVLLIEPSQSFRSALEPLLVAPQLERLHLLGHGAPGQIRLGRTTLTRRWIQQLPSLHWKGSLSSICIWSCNSASGSVGRAWLQLVADRCNASVFAADGPIGASSLGGSWQLSVRAEPSRVICRDGPGQKLHCLGPPRHAKSFTTKC